MTFTITGHSLDFGPMFMEAGPFSPSEATVVNVVKQPITVNPNDYRGIIITGSLSMATDLEPWTRVLLDWLTKAADLGIPILGICYGHHLMAMVYGGCVDYHPAGMELGSHEIVLAPGARNHPLLSALPDKFPAHLVHSQTVITPPSGAKVLARSNHDPHQILSYGEKVLTCQFHPEFPAPFMEILINDLASYSPPPGRPTGVVLGSEPIGPNHSQKLLRRFRDLV
jgi:GMP synthase (glutamine-hydrolysing)